MNENISCMLIRGGTSKGAYFLASDLPESEKERDDLLVRIMGSGEGQQINGIGGGTSLTSKVAIVSKSEQEGTDLDYLFAQVAVDKKEVDTKPSCGNILSGIVAFASENNLVKLSSPSTMLRVRNINTNTIIEVSAESPSGHLRYDGDVRVDGVPGTGSPVLLNFLDVGGSKTGKLFPTGNVRDQVEGVEVSCLDAAVPMVHINAKDFGLAGNETKQQLDDNAELLERIESIRLSAGRLMGMGDVTGSVVPKVSLLSPPTQDGHITSRYFVPQNCHASHAVTGGICVAAACMIPGTVAHEVCQGINSETVVIEHPSGQIQVNIKVEPGEIEPAVRQAALVRTARPLFKGQVYPTF
ncbi:4-oxalomesaconate tautomerase [Vibrio cyclitrophicus]